jgi:hypothetical protein
LLFFKGIRVSQKQSEGRISIDTGRTNQEKGKTKWIYRPEASIEIKQ